MNWGRWEDSKIIKKCDGCSELINVGDKYLLAKFALKDEGTNISRLYTLNLCTSCVDDFEAYAHGTETVDDSI